MYANTVKAILRLDSSIKRLVNLSRLRLLSTKLFNKKNCVSHLFQSVNKQFVNITTVRLEC